MTLQSLVIYLGCVIAVTLSPGPDILLVIAVSAAQGMRAGFAATLGFATGLIVHTTVAATGLSLVIRSSPAAFRVVQLFGAAYLVYLALRMIFAREKLSEGGEAGREVKERKSLWRIYQQCILMNVLNPKVMLFFLAFLQGFVVPQSAVPVWVQFVILGAIFAASTLVCFGACAAGAGALSRGFVKSAATARYFRWGIGGLFLALAVVLVVRG